jgi:hypothetical protein
MGSHAAGGLRREQCLVFLTFAAWENNLPQVVALSRGHYKGGKKTSIHSSAVRDSQHRFMLRFHCFFDF